MNKVNSSGLENVESAGGYHYLRFKMPPKKTSAKKHRAHKNERLLGWFFVTFGAFLGGF